MSQVDLSKLPAPQLLEDLDFEVLYQEDLASFRAQLGDHWSANLESDPVTKLIEVGAYRKLLNRARINDAAKALLLAYARGSDLDQLAANVSLQRLVIQAADPGTTPPTEAVLESDDALRERVQLVYEGLTTAGPRNSYILHARNASGRVADATAESPSPAVVDVTVLSLDGDGVASPELLAQVSAYLNDDDIRPVADRVNVRSAQVLPYQVEAVLHMADNGPEFEAILSECRRRLQAWINPRRRLGVEVARSGIDAQLHIDGVSRVELIGWSDIRPSKAQAAWCTGIDLRRGADMHSLLPLNRTPLERAIEVAADEDLKATLRTLYNPDTCPTHLLYQLAWAWSVDRWDDSWGEAIKRSVIRSAFFVHAHKGTLGALRRVVEPFGYLIEVQEWWQTEPAGVPGTFALKVGVTDTGISEQTYNELSSLIDDARPVSRHMTGLAISLESRGALHFGCALQDGDELDVYPPAPADVVVNGAIGRGGREHTIDTLDIAHG